MDLSESTSWTLIRGAAAGGVPERELFVRRYAAVMRAYLEARWRRSPLRSYVQDAAQEVFFECFRKGGALERVEPRASGFRAFLFGTVRNVARTAEARFRRDHAREGAHQDLMEDLAVADESPSRAFDRAWAISVLREAAEVHRERSVRAGERAGRRAELLRLRFQEGIPLREIAHRWELDPAFLHHEYACARREFKRALESVLRSHHPDSPGDMKHAWTDLKDLLGD